MHASGFRPLQTGEIGPSCRGDQSRGLARSQQMLGRVLQGGTLHFLP